MTIEVWLAHKLGLHATPITDVRIVATPGRAWSEITIEDFDATLSYRYDGEKRRLDLTEEDVCDLLNALWPADA